MIDREKDRDEEEEIVRQRAKGDKEDQLIPTMRMKLRLTICDIHKIMSYS